MKSQNIAYNPRIDHIRYFAATIVFLFHFNIEYHGMGGAEIKTSWLGIIKEGHTGVGLFFTLSGFLFMQIALHKKNIVYSQFIRNRFLRIFPLFFTVFLVATSIGRDKFLPQDILYLLSTNLGKAPTSDTVITGAAWCISLEFLFYFIFPFLARFTIERGYHYLFSLLVLMLFFKLASYPVTDRSSLMYFSTFVGRFDQFLIGMLAAFFYSKNNKVLHAHSSSILLFSIIFVFLNSALQSHFAPFDPSSKSVFWITWSLLESSVWALFILAWISFDKALPIWINRSFCQGGKISFSFYLLHMAVIHIFMQSFGIISITHIQGVDEFILGFLVYIITWGIALLSYKSIEEPFLLMRRNYGDIKSI